MLSLGAASGARSPTAPPPHTRGQCEQRGDTRSHGTWPGPAHPVLTRPGSRRGPREAAGAPGAAPERPPRGRGVQAPGRRGSPAFPSSGDPGHPNAAPRAPTGSRVRPRRAACGRRLSRRTSAALVGWEGSPTEGPARPGQERRARLERRARRPGPALRSWDPNVPAPGRSTRPLRSPAWHQGATGCGRWPETGGPPSSWAALLRAAGVSGRGGLNPSSSAGRLGGAARPLREEDRGAFCSAPTQALLFWKLVFTWPFFPPEGCSDANEKNGFYKP